MTAGAQMFGHLGVVVLLFCFCFFTFSGSRWSYICVMCVGSSSGSCWFRSVDLRVTEATMSSCTKGSHSRREPHIDLCQMVSLLSFWHLAYRWWWTEWTRLNEESWVQPPCAPRRYIILLACFLMANRQKKKKNWVSDKSSAFMSYSLLNAFFFGGASINKQRNIKRDFSQLKDSVSFLKISSCSPIFDYRIFLAFSQKSEHFTSLFEECRLFITNKRKLT